LGYQRNNRDSNNYCAYHIGEPAPNRTTIKIIGIEATRMPTKHSMQRIIRTIPEDTLISMDFITIPKITEKRTNPSLYSFFRGLKKVRTRRGSESKDTVYLLNNMKKFKRPPRTSLYQNIIRYSG